MTVQKNVHFTEKNYYKQWLVDGQQVDLRPLRGDLSPPVGALYLLQRENRATKSDITAARGRSLAWVKDLFWGGWKSHWQILDPVI